VVRSRDRGESCNGGGSSSSKGKGKGGGNGKGGSGGNGTNGNGSRTGTGFVTVDFFLPSTNKRVAGIKAEPCELKVSPEAVGLQPGALVRFAVLSFSWCCC
jgi:hypothetical protein